jgi:hypothetical protein
MPRPPADETPPDQVLQKIRVPFIQRARLVYEGREESGFLVDLALSGAFLERAESLPLGLRVEVSFPLPGNVIPLRAVCRVAWWHGPEAPRVSRPLPTGNGLEFLEIGTRDAARVREHIEAYLRRQPGMRRFHRNRTHEEPD